MKNLNSLFIEHGLYDQATLKGYAERHTVWLRVSTRFPHLGILHYKDDVVFGRGAWTDFTKACRGVVVDFQNKKLLSRPYDKFFNLNEAEAPSIKELEKQKNFWATEKLDGSMIILCWDEKTGQFFTTTKGSLDSEQGIYATSLIPESVKNVELVKSHTLMFELISPKFQIVVPYHKIGYDEGLYLIGVRHNMSEKVFNPDEVKAFAKQYGLKVYKTSTFPSLQAVEDNVKGLPYTEEGFVLVFENGDMVKIKSKEYLRVHRFISTLSDKNLLDIMILGEDKNVIDNLGSVPEEYRQDVIDTFDKYKKEAVMFKNTCYEWLAKCPREDRKTSAIWINGNVPGEYKRFLFQMLDEKDLQLQQIYSVFRKR
jgi:RNA ligase